MFEQGMMFLKSNLHSVQAKQSVNSVGKLEIPEIVLEELLQNSLVHRDYIKTAAIRLLVFDDRIEIINPGYLPAGLTVDDIKLGNSYQRNPLIANFCAKTMTYRGLGSGIIRALREGVKIDFVNNYSGDQFTCIISRIAIAKTDQVEPKTDQVEPKTDQVEPKSDLSEKQLSILNFCSEPKTAKEILHHIGFASNSTNRKNFISALIKKGLLTPTNPEKPRAKNQKYIKKF